MKRILSALTVFLMVFLMLSPAHADILWEPGTGDRFFADHREECTDVEQVYEVPPDSTVNIYDAPDSDEVIDTAVAGDRIWVGYSLEYDGIVWGLSNCGWIHLGRLQLVYDNTEFMKEFRDTLTEDDGQLQGYLVKKQICTWTYPGSGELERTMTPEDYPDISPFSLSFNDIYTDPDGGQWGYIGYYMGRCGWVYLNDPESESAPVFPHGAESTVTETGEEIPPEKHGVTLIAGLVLGTAAVTTALIYRLKPKKD